MATTTLSLESLATELKTSASAITEYLTSKNLTFEGLTDTHLSYVKNHFNKAAKMPPAPPKMNGSVPVELPKVPNTDLNSMSMEELTAYYSEQQLKLTRAEMIAKITGNEGLLLEVQGRTLEAELVTQKAKVTFDVKNASQSQLLTLSSEAIERVQRDVTGREIQAPKDYEEETLKTPTNGQVGVLSAKKLRAIQEARTAMILNATPSEIPLLKSADEPTITTIDA